jgi:hypothetical protein
MFWVIGLAGGALYGAFLAGRRGGKPLDRLHYAAAFAIAFGLMGLFADIALVRML